MNRLSRQSGGSGIASTRTAPNASFEFKNRGKIGIHASILFGVIALLVLTVFLLFVKSSDSLTALLLGVSILLLIFVFIGVQNTPKNMGVQNIIQKEKERKSKLSHDIKNALAVIKMDAEVSLMTDNSKEELRQTLQRIDEEADKINDLLTKNR